MQKRLQQQMVVLKRMAVIGFMLFGTVGMNSGNAQENLPLFTYVSETDISEKQIDRLNAYRSDPTAKKMKIVRIDTAHIPTTGSVTVNLFACEDFQLSGMRLVRRTPNNYSLFGKTMDADGELTLVVDGRDVVGTIRKGAQLYSVRPLGGGIQVLILRDQKAFPPDEPPGFQGEMAE